MILTVDIGNTHIKLGAWDHEALVFVARLQTDVRRTQDEYAVDLLNMMKLNGCNSAQFDGAIIASVVPALSAMFREAVMTVIGTGRVYLVSPGLKTGLNIKIDNPAQLGADLVCAGVAAIQKYTQPCIIVSLGTATAIFAIDGDGNYLGGAVCAGVTISLEALSQNTAQLPHISLDEPAGVIGSNTIDAIKSGVIYGTAGLLDGMVGRMKEELGGEAAVIATGGLAQAIIPHCRQQMEIDDTLVLEGLRLIYHKNNTR